MPALHDLFFSYRTSQAAAARPLLEALARTGLRIWRDETRVDNGDSISGGVRAGLSSSRALLAWYSPDYDDSLVCRWELRGAWVSAEAVGKPTDRVAIVLPPGFTDPRKVLPGRALRAEHDELCFISPADPNDMAAWDALAERLAVRVRALDDRGFAELRPLDAAPRWVPHRRSGSNRFVGRRGELWELHGALQASKHVAVTGVDRSQTAQVRGLGGVGKTLLATEYAVLFERAWPGGVYWFDAAGRSPTELFAELGARIGVVAPTGKADETEAMVRAHLARVTEPYLWILDDIPVELTQREVEARSAPGGGGHTLVTTRSRTLAALGRSLDLGVLTAGEALDLLTRRRPPGGDAEQAAARALCEQVGNHPIAVDVLGALVAEEGGSAPYRFWQERLGREDRDALALGEELAEELPTGVSRSVAVVLGRSLAQLGPEGWDVLRAAACLAAAPIPDSLLAAALAPEGGEEEGRDALRRGRSQLLRHSLVGVLEGAVSVHALVSRAVRLGDRDRERAVALEDAVVRAIAAALQGVEEVQRHADLSKTLFHARHLVHGDFPPARGEVAHRVAHHDSLRGQFREAELVWRRLARVAEECLGPAHPGTLTTTQNLAGTLLAQGKMAEARALLERSLEALTRLLGPEHPDTLTTTENLALTLQAQGDIVGARVLLERALGTRTRLLGPGHPDTLGTTQKLATTLRAQGDLAGARALAERALLARTPLLGAEHPDTLIGIRNLATTLSAQGDVEDARALLEYALEAQTRLLGPEHPDVLRTTRSLGEALSSLGEVNEARVLKERALSDQSRLLGPDHPEALRTTQSLAVTLKALGDLQQARMLEERALEGFTRVLGPDHPDSLTTAQNLAATLTELGDLPGALAIEERTLVARTRLSGPEHPHTHAARFNLVLTLLQLDPSAAGPGCAASGRAPLSGRPGGCTAPAEA